MRTAKLLAMLISCATLLFAACEEKEPPANNPTPENPDDPEKPDNPVEEAAFEIVITEKTTLSFTFNIYPKDKTMEYIFLTDTTRVLEESNVVTGEDFVAYNNWLFYSEAETFDTTVEELVKDYYIYTGDVENVEINGIRPGDEFVIYAYGADIVDGEVLATTEVVVVRDRTEEVEIVEHAMAIDVTVDGSHADIAFDPNGFDGNYLTIVESVATLCPDGDATDDKIKAKVMDMWYNALTVYLQYGFALEMILGDLAVVGEYQASYDLLANTEYVATAMPIDSTGVIYAYPTIEYFSTSDVEMSDNTIDISVSNILPREATITVTPSNDDPFIVACFESSPYNGMTDEQIIADYIATFPLYPMSGGFTYTFTGLNPETEYFVAAFGCEGGVVTTELFRVDFVTAKEQMSNINIELNIIGYYDIEEVAALNDYYQSFVGTYAALFAYEFITTPQAMGIHYGLYSKASVEGIDDDDLRKMILERPIKDTFRPVNFIRAYGLEYVLLAVAVDSEGNPSKLFKSDVITITYDGRSDAQEFIDMMH